MRFDEIELEAVILEEAAPAEPLVPSDDASRWRRLLALVTDLSLFAALTLALSPLLPAIYTPWTIAALAGFILVVSYYYFAGTWLLWGKSIGGTIFDVKIVPQDDTAMSLRAATLRWVGMLLSLLTAGIGFLFALLPSRLSLPDRVSGTRCIAAS